MDEVENVRERERDLHICMYVCIWLDMHMNCELEHYRSLQFEEVVALAQSTLKYKKRELLLSHVLVVIALTSEPWVARTAFSPSRGLATRVDEC